MSENQTLLWCDIETTGLDPQKDEILEICIMKAAFDKPFDAVEIYHSVLGFQHFSMCSDFIKELHTKNGLFAECKQSIKSRYYVEKALCQLIPPYTEDKEEQPILAGSTIHFDKSFLAYHMPEFHKRLSHRLYDVSAIKLFCHSLGMPRFIKAEAHRAKEDILESISHAQQCKDWIYQRGYQLWNEGKIFP